MAWWSECLFGQALGPEVEPQYPHKSGHWLCTSIITELGRGNTGIFMECVVYSQIQWEILSNTTWREREWHSVSTTGLCEYMCGCMCLPLRQSSLVTENRKMKHRPEMKEAICICETLLNTGFYSKHENHSWKKSPRSMLFSILNKDESQEGGMWRAGSHAPKIFSVSSLIKKIKMLRIRHTLSPGLARTTQPTEPSMGGTGWTWGCSPRVLGTGCARALKKASRVLLSCVCGEIPLRMPCRITNRNSPRCILFPHGKSAGSWGG